MPQRRDWRNRAKSINATQPAASRGKSPAKPRRQAHQILRKPVEKRDGL